MHHLTIADTRFTLTGELNTDLFNESFLPFLNADVPFDTECDVVCQGAEDEVSSLPPVPEEPWSFRMKDEQCDIRRRNEAGETIWRISAPSDFGQATVAWDRTRFAHHYKSYEKAWGTGLGLSLLVLRIRKTGGLVFHGSAAVLDGQGVLCVGVSGTGKSTIAGLIEAGEGTALSDEHPVVRQEKPVPGASSPSASFRVHGSPWPSSAGFARNESAPLARIYFLEHGPENRVTRLSAREAISRLIHVAVIPWQAPSFFDPCLATVETLLASVPASVLSFCPDETVVDTIRQDLEEKS